MADDQKGQGQGQVKDPANDGRLKENGGGQASGQAQQGQPKAGAGPDDRRHEDNGQGQVKDPENDGRLKQNG